MPNELDLNKEGLTVEIDRQVELSAVARALLRSGNPGIIAEATADGNGFWLQLADLGASYGQQLQLRRMPAGGIAMGAAEMFSRLYDLGLAPIYSGPALELLAQYAWELNSWCRIKEIRTIDSLTSIGQLHPVISLEMKDGLALPPTFLPGGLGLSLIHI